MLGLTRVSQGRLAEAESWLDRAVRTLRRIEAEPAAGICLYHARGLLEFAHGRHQQALAEWQAADRLADRLVTSHTGAASIQANTLQTLLRLGRAERVETALAGLDEHGRDSAEMRTTLAALRLAQHDPQAAATALAPILDGSVRKVRLGWMVTAWLLEAITRDALGDPAAAGRALEHALEVAEPERSLIQFLLYPAPGLLERHARQRTAHAALLAEILGLLGGTSSPAAPPDEPRNLREPLSQAETRVLRYLPTNLTAPEIADQLYLSVNTVWTHMRHIYAKFGVHRRRQAVERAQALGLLAPSWDGT
jgi:LuxR family maltose regulon positive regulatory protein